MRRIFLLMLIPFVSCSKNSTTSRTQSPPSADVSTASEAVPIAGTNLASIAGVSERCLPESGCREKVFAARVRLEDNHEVILTRATAAALGINTAMWSFSGEGVSCKNADQESAELSFSPSCKASEPGFAVQAVIRITTGKGFVTSGSNQNEPDIDEKKTYLFASNQKFNGSWTATSQDGLLSADAYCEASGAPALRAAAGPGLHAKWFAILEGNSTANTFAARVKARTGSDTHLYVSSSEPGLASVVFANGVYTAEPGAKFKRLVSASNHFLNGLRLRSSEILNFDFAPLTEDLFWYGTGCNSWSQSTAAELGSGIHIPKLPTKQVDLLGQTCDQKALILCAGIEE